MKNTTRAAPTPTATIWRITLVTSLLLTMVGWWPSHAHRLFAQVDGTIDTISPAGPPHKHVLPSSGSQDAARKRGERLIESLLDTSEMGAGYDTNVDYAGEFAPLDGGGPPSQFYEHRHNRKPSEIMRELVAYGPNAAPCLVVHLSDKRETRLAVEHRGTLGRLIFAREYDYNERTVKKSPKAVVRPYDIDWTETEEEDSRGWRGVTIGDLCFVALGQIVNREFIAVRAQPTNCIVVNSPSYSSALRAAIVSEWGNLTPEKHKASLVADVTKPDYEGRAWRAILRLSFYYPDCVDDIALQYLHKPWYSARMVRDFAQKVLYQTASEDGRRRAFDESTRKYGQPFAEGLLLELLSDSEWDRMQKTSEVETDPKILLARRILAELYPGVNGNKTTYVASERWGYQADALDALAWHPSVKLDDAAYDLFKRLGHEESDAAEDDLIALACIRRLARKGHDNDFEDYLRKRIPVVEQQPFQERLVVEMKTLLGLLHREGDKRRR